MENIAIGNNIKISEIDNKTEVENIIKNVICYVCLEVPFYPMQCYLCDVKICKECHNTLKLSDKDCITSKCKGDIRKANKLLREMLQKLKVTCHYCYNNSIDYKDLKKHLEEKCEIYNLVDYKKTNYHNLLDKKSDVIDNLRKEIEKYIHN